jgi:2-iminoacetate synthase ThiH
MSRRRVPGRATCCAARPAGETGGFTEFVPLPFVHMEAPMYRRAAPQGPTLREAVLMHAVARLVLHPLIPTSRPRG